MEFSTTIRPVIVDTFPVGSVGDCVVLSTDGHLYTYDGTSWVDNGLDPVNNVDGGTPEPEAPALTLDGGTP